MVASRRVRARINVDAHGREQLREFHEFGGVIDARRQAARHVARAETHLTLCWTRENAIWVDQFADAYEWVNGRPLQMRRGLGRRGVPSRRDGTAHRADVPRGRSEHGSRATRGDARARRRTRRARPRADLSRVRRVNPRHNTKFCHACEAIDERGDARRRTRGGRRDEGRVVDDETRRAVPRGAACLQAAPPRVAPEQPRGGAACRYRFE